MASNFLLYSPLLIYVILTLVSLFLPYRCASSSTLKTRIHLLKQKKSAMTPSVSYTLFCKNNILNCLYKKILFPYISILVILSTFVNQYYKSTPTQTPIVAHAKRLDTHANPAPNLYMPHLAH